MDLSRARSALDRCKAAALEGAEDEETREFRHALAELLGEAGAVAVSSADKLAADVEVANSMVVGGSRRGGFNGGEGRGEVILKMTAGADSKVKAAILEKVVALRGVVSVTFEGDLIIVSTRTPAIAADAGFLADLLVSVKEQGLQGVSLISAAAAGVQGSANEGSDDAIARLPESTGVVDTRQEEREGEADLDAGADDGDDAEPAYLDDEEDEEAIGLGADGQCHGGPRFGGARVGVGVGGPAQGGAQWSFFSQSNWMTGRRMQEFGDDPTIAARLAAAKRREEERRQENKSRLGQLSTWLMGSK